MNQLKRKVLLVVVTLSFFGVEVFGQETDETSGSDSIDVSTRMEQILARAQVAASAADIVLRVDKLRRFARQELQAGRREEAGALLREASDLITVAMSDGDGKRDDVLLRQYLADIKALLVDSDSFSYSIELATLELTDEEQTTNTPVALNSIRQIEAASRRGSLGFSFQAHPLIQQFINYHQRRGRSTMEAGLSRSGQFTLMARRIFREEGVPENLVWLGQVESGWNPWARSWAAASGLWQFIPGTGARYGLRQTVYVDERYNYEKATRASARYLKFLANRYGGNWELAMAGYNSGEGNVDRAIARARVATFWAIYPYLPRETRNYVPSILATILIANNPNKYGFGHVRPMPPLIYAKARIPTSTNLSLIAQSLRTTVEVLRYLNPDLRQNFTPPENYLMLVPVGTANRLDAGLLRQLPVTANINRTSNVRLRRTSQTAPGPLVKVKSKLGDTIARIASRYRFPAVEIARLNGVMPNTPLPVGREILLTKRT